MRNARRWIRRRMLPAQKTKMQATLLLQSTPPQTQTLRHQSKNKSSFIAQRATRKHGPVRCARSTPAGGRRIPFVPRPGRQWVQVTAHTGLDGETAWTFLKERAKQSRSTAPCALLLAFMLSHHKVSPKTKELTTYIGKVVLHACRDYRAMPHWIITHFVATDWQCKIATPWKECKSFAIVL